MPPSPGARRASPTLAVALGAGLAILDSTIVTLALRALSVELGVSLADIQWIVTAYLLVLAVVVPVSAWIAGRFGARRSYLTAVLVFVAGSALSGCAGSLEFLLAARLIQAAGAGVLVPVGQMLVVRGGDGASVLHAVGIPITLGPTLGPIVGGLLLGEAGWRWIFFVNVPLGLAVFAIAAAALPRDPERVRERLDVAGAVLVGGAMATITFGLARLAATGSLTEGSVAGLLSIGVLLLAAFVAHTRRRRDALLDLRLYRHAGFRAASLATFALGASGLGGIALIALYIQEIAGASPTATGLVVGAQGVGIGLAIVVVGRLVARLGNGATAALGALVTIAGTLPFALAGSPLGDVTVTACLFVRGVGIGLSVTPAIAAALSLLGLARVDHAAPQLNMLQRLGGSIGTAVVATALHAQLTTAGADPREAYATTFWWVLGFLGLAAAGALLLALAERIAPATAPA